MFFFLDRIKVFYYTVDVERKELKEWVMNGPSYIEKIGTRDVGAAHSLGDFFLRRSVSQKNLYKPYQSGGNCKSKQGRIK